MAQQNDNNIPVAPETTSSQPYQSIQPCPQPEIPLSSLYQRTASITPAAAEGVLSDPAKKYREKDKTLEEKKLPGHVPGSYEGYEPGKGIGGFKGPGGFSGGLFGGEKGEGGGGVSRGGEGVGSVGSGEGMKEMEGNKVVQEKDKDKEKSKDDGSKSPRFRNLKRKLSALGRKR